MTRKEKNQRDFKMWEKYLHTIGMNGTKMEAIREAQNVSGGLSEVQVFKIIKIMKKIHNYVD